MAAEADALESCAPEGKSSTEGLLCTEEEPDDDFRPRAGKSAGASKQAEPEGREETSGSLDVSGKPQVEQEESPVDDGTPMLTGHWHQLEGVPRAKRDDPRFLVWSDHGHVSFFPTQRRLEVIYAGEEAERISDFAGLEMASLSGKACCLAAGAGAEGGSRLLIRPGKRWDKAVFSAALGSPGEAVEAVACGDTFVAALTSHRLLRVYATSGLPLGVVSMPGRSVALAARGQLLLAVISTTSQNLPLADEEDEALEFRLLNVHDRSQRAAGRLPLSPGARLRWLGLSAELAPVSVDTSGVVRVLLGSGPGSWGPAGGGGGEWVPVASLAEEEAEAGPLWTVHAERGALFCAELGSEGFEPEPEVAEQGLTPHFGHGCSLREVRWRLPVGPLLNLGSTAEEVLREQLLARHVEETSAAGLLCESKAAGMATLSKGWRTRAFNLFGQLAKAGEVERALDVARSFLAAGAGGSRLLTFAQDFAEKAGLFKLADEVAALPRLAAESNVGSSTGFGAALPPTRARSVIPQAVPKVQRQELPPLFEPGEVEREKSGSQESAAISGSTPTSPSASPTAPPAPTPSASPTAARASPVSNATKPAATSASRASSIRGLLGKGPAEAVSVSAASDGQQVDATSTSAPPAVISTPPAPAPPPVSANPFARKRPGLAKPAQTPHLLRDALGGGASRRAPPTPMGASPGAGGEPPSKVARTGSK
mmetsp:Transcript_130567/g.226953  ORF Transcript_130567/g.226953 Transcript_130567/m.226953 type:complete len:711 (+) Transcript_130567:46-2178(+)